MFEAFARPARRVSSSTICLGGRSGELPQNADGWRSFYAWKPKRGLFSSSKTGIPARRVANPHASSKPPARETATRNEARRFGINRHNALFANSENAAAVATALWAVSVMSKALRRADRP